jgi:hypothetical protein
MEQTTQHLILGSVFGDTPTPMTQQGPMGRRRGGTMRLNDGSGGEGSRVAGPKAVPGGPLLWFLQVCRCADMASAVRSLGDWNVLVTSG